MKEKCRQDEHWLPRPLLTLGLARIHSERFCSHSEVKQTCRSHNTSELLEAPQQRVVNDSAETLMKKQHCSNMQAY